MLNVDMEISGLCARNVIFNILYQLMHGFDNRNMCAGDVERSCLFSKKMYNLKENVLRKGGVWQK